VTRALAAAVALAVAAAALGGCALAPYSDETLPPIERHGLRVTKGIGSADEYAEVIEAYPGSTIQILTEIADGKTVIVSFPRGPAAEIDVTAHVEGEPAEEGVTSTIRSGDGGPLTLEGAFEFTPGYVGVEDHSNAEEISVRLATPRLTGTGQGQVPFTFKTKAR
jgi:hypothetical protein